MRGQVLAAAAVASALMFAQPAAAQGGYYSATPAQTRYEQDCRARQNQRMLGGGAIGAVAGAVLGNNLGGRGRQGDGTVLGAVLGAAAGAAIGRTTARCDANGQYRQGYNQPYQQPYQQPYNEPYRNDDDLYGGPYTPSAYQGGGYDNRQCRWGEQVMRDPEGYEYTENVYMCRGRDGRWHAQNN